ncbi:hypothetical protein [Streptomyces rochei]|uniref:hypothetical protein n=1 Tax=Streptomyces rochei TaxID=1928 RepID=UPI00353077D2
MALDDARTPRQGQPGGDRGKVSFQAVGEGVKTRQVVGANRLDPLRELVPLELDDHPPERVDVVGERVQFSTVRHY